MKIINLEHDFFCTTQNSIISKDSRVFSDRVSYIILRGPWCNIIVLNVRAPSEERSDDSQDSFYGELD